MELCVSIMAGTLSVTDWENSAWAVMVDINGGRGKNVTAVLGDGLAPDWRGVQV